MVKLKLARVAAATAASAGLIAGFGGGVVSAHSFHTSSSNSLGLSLTGNFTGNQNESGVNNFSLQGAASGDVLLTGNKGASGNVSSGKASNLNATTATVTQSNSSMSSNGVTNENNGVASGDVATGDNGDGSGQHHSGAQLAVALTANVTENTNEAVVNNTTIQNAQSGKVVVAGNEGAMGNVSSGDTANGNTTIVTVSSSNSSTSGNTVTNENNVL